MEQDRVIPGADDSPEENRIYAKTDMTALAEVIQEAALANKKGFEEMIKLHRNMYGGIIQKQNDELETYRRGALRQSKVDLLRAVAAIYLENCQSAAESDNPAEALKYVISMLRELLEDNDVNIVQSNSLDAFDRKMMKTRERYVVPTADAELERKVAGSIKPGFVFFGDPLIQEEVSVYKYDPQLAPPEPESAEEPVVLAEAPVESVAPVDSVAETDGLSSSDTAAASESGTTAASDSGAAASDSGAAEAGDSGAAEADDFGAAEADEILAETEDSADYTTTTESEETENV